MRSRRHSSSTAAEEGCAGERLKLAFVTVRTSAHACCMCAVVGSEMDGVECVLQVTCMLVAQDLRRL